MQVFIRANLIRAYVSNGLSIDIYIFKKICAFLFQTFPSLKNAVYCTLKNCRYVYDPVQDLVCALDKDQNFRMYTQY